MTSTTTQIARLFLGALLASLLLSTCVLAQEGEGEGPSSNAASGSTPRTADGKPKFDGYYGRLQMQDAQEGGGSHDIQFANNEDGHLKGTVEGFQRWLTHFEKDGQINRRRQRNRPIYKPEYWEKIRFLDWDNSRKKDPSSHCLPAVPLIGLPQRIVQMPNEMIFFYENLNRYRIIPTNGKQHDPVKVSIPTWFGDSVAHWEGDTLVIETVGIIEASWIGGIGYPHTETMKVTERMTRQGDAMRLERIIEDPMLLQPWHMDVVQTRANNNPKAELWEQSPCDERDKEFEGDPFEGH